jgi:N-hydroxyarylamine O-acetyltransferase
MQDADARTDVIKAGAVCIIANDAANHDCAEHNSQDRHQGGIVRWRFAVDFGSHRHGDVFGQLHQANVADCPVVPGEGGAGLESIGQILLVANPAGTPGNGKQPRPASPIVSSPTANGRRNGPGAHRTVAPQVGYGSPPKTRGGADVGHVGGDKRGGYCFEQNMLFRAGLRSLGYGITSLQGRVVRGLAIDAPRPAIHMLLKVELPEGTYLADVGFGNLAPTCALLLAPHVEQETPHEVMRFIDVGGELTLQAWLKHGWQHIYRVIPYSRYDGEYEITNWYTATHPDTPYQGNIIVAKPGPNRSRITMYNARVTVRDAEGNAEKRWLTTDGEFRDVLRGEFGLNMSDRQVDECVAIMKAKGTGDAPHPFFA